MTQSVFWLGLWSSKIRPINNLRTISHCISASFSLCQLDQCRKLLHDIPEIPVMTWWKPNEGRALRWHAGHVIDPKATSHPCRCRYFLSFCVKRISKRNWQHPLTFSLQLILPRAMLEGVRAGHLHVHMNSSGLLTAFLRPGLIYKSACTVSDLHIFLSIYGHCLRSRQCVFFCQLLCECAGRARARSVNNSVHHSV